MQWIQTTTAAALPTAAADVANKVARLVVGGHEEESSSSHAFIIGLALGVGAMAVYPFLERASLIARYELRVLFKGRAMRRLRDKLLLIRQEQLAAAEAFVAEAPPTAEHLATLPRLPAAELVRLQQQGAVSAVQLLRVFLTRAIEAHKASNCCVAFCVATAVAEAEACDRHLQETGSPIGPLHGVPVSIKDQFDMTGYYTTIGILSVAHKAEHDATVVQLLREAGAVLHVRTNVPQLMLSYECTNHVYGTTTHPLDKSLTPGGSSGGEGVLLATGGTVIGIGSDIGGSIRGPAHFCGVVGLKPTQYRVSLQGAMAVVKSQEAVSGVAGPLARCVEDLALAMDVLTGEGGRQRDGTTLSVPFRREIFTKYGGEGQRKLRIGFYLDDGFVRPAPACQRAVLIAVQALRDAGHEVVEFTPPRMGDVQRCFFSLMSADCGRGFLGALDADPPIPFLRNLLLGVVLPMKPLLAAAAAAKDKLSGGIIGALREKSVAEYYALQYERNQLRNAFAEAFAAARLDAVVCPGYSSTAIAIDSSAQVSFGSQYCGAHNVLDTAVATVQVTRVDPLVDAWPAPTAAEVAQDVRLRESPVAMEKVRAMYRNVAGLPVGVQVVGPRFGDEQVLGVAHTLERLLKSCGAADPYTNDLLA